MKKSLRKLSAKAQAVLADKRAEESTDKTIWIVIGVALALIVYKAAKAIVGDADSGLIGGASDKISDVMTGITV